MRITEVSRTREPRPDKVKERIESMNKLLAHNNIRTEIRPQLIVSSKIHKYISALHKNYADSEWFAYGRVVQDKDKNFILTDLYHPQQEAHGTETSPTDEGAESLSKYVIDNYGEEDLKYWSMHLHSHHRMGLFWSATDDKSRLDLSDGRMYSISMVTAYENTEAPFTPTYKACINFYKPYNIEIDLDVRPEEHTTPESILEYHKKLSTLKEEVYNKEAQLPNLDNVTDLLGDYFSEVLTKNFKEVVYKKLSNDLLQKEYEERVKEIPLPQELVDEQEFHNKMLAQLKEAIVKPATSPGLYMFNDDLFFTADEYPNLQILEDAAGEFPQFNKPYLLNGVWSIFYKGKRMTLDEYYNLDEVREEYL